MSLLSSLFGNRTVLCDGAMGTALYGRGVFLNKCFDELNLTQPELVRSVHEEYLQAGAEIIETNTFGANSFRLHRFGLQDQARAINQAGARLAREAVIQLADKQAGSAFVAGSVGPLGVHLEPLGKIALEEARDAFADQIEGLVAGGPGVGVDLLVVETMPAINEAEQAIYAAKRVAPETPLMAMVTVDEDANCLDGTPADVAAARLTAAGADAIGCNCSTGPVTVLTAIERMRAATDLPLVAMPNAGMPRNVDGRNIYLCFAGVHGELCAQVCARRSAVCRRLLRHDTEPHTRHEVRYPRAGCAADRGSAGGAHARSSRRRRLRRWPNARRSEAWSPPASSSRWWRLCRRAGSIAAKEIEGARMLAGTGIHAINIPDSPRASARMSAQSLCLQIQQQTGIETVLHYTCRDRNVLSHPVRPAGRFVAGAAQHSVPDRRSAEAGELSGCDGGVRRGRDRAGEYRAQAEPRAGHWRRIRSARRRGSRSAWRRIRAFRTSRTRFGASHTRWRRARSMRSRSRSSILQPDAFKIEIHLLARHCVKCAEGLVHEQKGRIAEQRAADGDALAHAAGQLPGIILLEAGKAGARQQIDGRRRELPPVEMADVGLSSTLSSTVRHSSRASR